MYPNWVRWFLGKVQLASSFGVCNKNGWFKPVCYLNLLYRALWHPKESAQYGEKFWPKISNFGVVYQPIELKMKPMAGILSLKIIAKPSLKNSKRNFWPNWFSGYTSFGVEKITKSRSFKDENNAQSLLKQLQNNFEKVQKKTFLTPKIVKK